MYTDDTPVFIKKYKFSNRNHKNVQFNLKIDLKNAKSQELVS